MFDKYLKFTPSETSSATPEQPSTEYKQEFAEKVAKVYSRSLCSQEIRYNFAVLQPISKFRTPVDISLRLGSIYTQRERGALTLPKLAVCPIKKVWDVPETAKNAMTYTHAIERCVACYVLNGHKNSIITCACVNCFRNSYFRVQSERDRP